jgi:multiple sugar transport system permease protein
MSATPVAGQVVAAAARRPGMNQRARTQLSYWAMVGPLLLGTLIFSYGPLLWGMAVSLFESRLRIDLDRFVGLENYVYVLTNEAFQKSLVTVVLFAAFIVPTTYLSAMLLAVLVQNAVFGKSFFRTVFFIPTAISYVVASLVWRMSIFNGLPYGVANQILWLFKIDSIAWIGLAHPPVYWLVLVTVRLWLQLGFQMILIIAAMQDIPLELYEAARVDGAESKWLLFRFITFPMLRNISVFLILLNIIHAFNAFAEFYNILGGTMSSAGMISLARPPLVWLFQVAMSEQRYGVASAGGVVVGLLIILVTVIQNKISGGLGKEI